ncbi:MAG: response regulator [Bacteroidetes bacterium]|nr:response regulator [Bacteroidota bacterium]
MNVLIIDESPVVSGRLKQILTDTGIPMVVYQSVEHVRIISLFSSIRPLIVLLDMELRGTLANELLQQIKNTGIQTSILALVNSEECSNKLKANNPGVNMIIDKYHEFDLIPGIVEEMITKTKHNADYEKPNQHPKFA